MVELEYKSKVRKPSQSDWMQPRNGLIYWPLSNLVLSIVRRKDVQNLKKSKKQNEWMYKKDFKSWMHCKQVRHIHASKFVYWLMMYISLFRIDTTRLPLDESHGIITTLLARNDYLTDLRDTNLDRDRLECTTELHNVKYI